jgi:hypothetical protein
VALYVAEEAPGGWRHSTVGPYDFAPVASPGRGTAVVPSILVNSNGKCTLVFEDRISGKPLTLIFKESDGRPLPSVPETMKLLSSHEIEEFRASDPERYRLYTERWDAGTFSAEEVDRQRQNATNLNKAVQQAVNHGRTLPPGAEHLFARSGTALEHVRPGLPVEADSPEALAFQEMINARNELSQNLRNASFEY